VEAICHIHALCRQEVPASVNCAGPSRSLEAVPGPVRDPRAPRERPASRQPRSLTIAAARAACIQDGSVSAGSAGHPGRSERCDPEPGRADRYSGTELLVGFAAGDGNRGHASAGSLSRRVISPGEVFSRGSAVSDKAVKQFLAAASAGTRSPWTPAVGCISRSRMLAPCRTQRVTSSAADSNGSGVRVAGSRPIAAQGDRIQPVLLAAGELSGTCRRE
jgi:hypothetical protein